MQILDAMIRTLVKGRIMSRVLNMFMYHIERRMHLQPYPVRVIRSRVEDWRRSQHLGGGLLNF
jgi:hypothetical protein